MSPPRRRRRDPRTAELLALGRKLRREGRMSRETWQREAAPIYARWAGRGVDAGPVRV